MGTSDSQMDTNDTRTQENVAPGLQQRGKKDTSRFSCSAHFILKMAINHLWNSAYTIRTLVDFCYDISFNTFD